MEWNGFVINLLGITKRRVSNGSYGEKGNFIPDPLIPQAACRFSTSFSRNFAV
jgi:hypothetical protein